MNQQTMKQVRENLRQFTVQLCGHRAYRVYPDGRELIITIQEAQRLIALGASVMS